MIFEAKKTSTQTTEHLFLSFKNHPYLKMIICSNEKARRIFLLLTGKNLREKL